VSIHQPFLFVISAPLVWIVLAIIPGWGRKFNRISQTCQKALRALREARKMFALSA
jgi:hypothetical protein